MGLTDRTFSWLRDFIVVMSLFVFHGFGHADDSLQRIDLKEVNTNYSTLREKKLAEIEELLKKHDLCMEGKQFPDSVAAVYITEALDIAKTFFGLNSEVHTDIFTDYVIPYVDDKTVLIETLYPFATIIFDKNLDYIWKALYPLAFKMKNFNEFDKAIDLLERIVESNSPSGAKCAAKIELARIRYKLYGENPTEILIPLLDEIEIEELPGKGELKFKWAEALSDYYSDIEDNEKLLHIIEVGEQYTNYATSHEEIMLLNKKCEILLKTDHLKAIECLDKIIELAKSNGIKTQDDRDWLSVALLHRGDYCAVNLLDYSEASNYYLQALYASTDSLTTINKISLVVLEHLNTVAEYNDFDDMIIKTGEALFNRIIPVEACINEAPGFVLSIIEAYIRAEEFSKASDLLQKYDTVVSNSETDRRGAVLPLAFIKIQEKKYKEAAHYLEALVNGESYENLGLNAMYLLALAYSHIGDDRMNTLSSCINSTTKQVISEKIKMISPNKRANWVEVCEDALSSQLSIINCETAIKNALELNLFKKSLLLRTSESIKRNIIENYSPGYQEKLSTLHNELVFAINRGDSLETSRLRQEYDRFEQNAISEFLNQYSLLPDIDVKMEDVLRVLDGNSVAVDFVSIPKGDQYRLGAFVFSKKLSPKYVPLFEYGDSIPSDSLNNIWQNFASYIEGYENLYFCGDGIVNSFPIEYGKVDKNLHIYDILKPHRVFHLSDIRSSMNVGHNICFVGVADHTGEKSESITRGNWIDLPNVKFELESITNHFPSDRVTVLFNETASEEAFSLLDESDITTLHISTHGVFRNEKALLEAANDQSSDDYHIAKRTLSANEPYLSAIILYSGNQFWKCPNLESNLDDILTTNEIESLHFPNLNLTVLSACETGLGEIDSEGVWGLQRAFRIAGTKNLICTLSKVDDYWTAQFMDAFYQQAAAGNTIYDSFHTAQRWLRRELPDNPEIWSSFILIE